MSLCRYVDMSLYRYFVVLKYRICRLARAITPCLKFNKTSSAKLLMMFVDVVVFIKVDCRNES